MNHLKEIDMIQRGEPILVAGAIRSETTWIGRTLAYSRNVGYVNEVFNPKIYNYNKETIFQQVFSYVNDHNAEPYWKDWIL